MTSASTLPTIGPAPPNVRRVPVPPELRPQGPVPVEGPIAARAADQGERPANTSEARGPIRQGSQTDAFPLPDNLARSAAVAVQVAESEDTSPSVNAAVPRILPTPSAGGSVDPTALSREGESASLSNELTEEEQAYVRELQAIDREVRAHERAHANTGGGFAGPPTYEYVTGPDGRQYAVSGRVQIDVSAVEGDPEATIRKLETVRRAALAPAQPSGQDRAVAAQAAASIRQAEAELSARRNEEAEAALGGEDETELERRAGAGDAPSDQADQVDQVSSQGEDGGPPPSTVNQIADRAFVQASLLARPLEPGLEPGDAGQLSDQRLNLIA